MPMLRRRRRDSNGEGDSDRASLPKVIKGWDHVRQRLQKKDPEIMEEEFCIFLGDVPTLIRTLTPPCYFRDVDHVRCGDTDTFYFVGLSSNVTKYTVGDHGRFIMSETLKFPYPMIFMKHMTESNAFMGLNPERMLVVLSLSRGMTKEACQVEQLFNARCIITIPETGDVVVGGVGFLKLYHVSGIKERRAIEVTGEDINTTLLPDEWVIDMKVDSFDHSLLVLIDSGIVILSYRDWREMYRLMDPEGGTIICCCLDGSNSFLITGSRYGCVKVWSMAIKVMHHKFPGHQDSVKAIACHKKQPVVVSGSADGWVFIWRLDTLRKFKKIKVGNDSVNRLEISSHGDCESVGFWCATETTFYFYELAEPYRIFASMDSMVVKLKRLLGYDKYPNRILVATWDGGVWFKNPVTAETVGFMFPIISLKIVEKYSYDVIKQKLYIVLPSGEVLVLNCAKTPFRALEQQNPDYPDEAVVSIVDVLLSVGTADHSFEAVAVLVGLVNGQIELLESDNLYMGEALQAHPASVQCLETLTELTEDRQSTCASCRVLLSAGSDMCVKIWRLRVQAQQGMGFELLFHNVMEIRCDKMPKYLSAVDDRVAIVFTGYNMTEIYDVGKEAIQPRGQFSMERPRYLQQTCCFSHTPDYDHTDTVTALDKCPLLRLFATASMDKTVKIWDDSNTLIRELLFEEPVVDICFVTDIGDLMIARDFVLVFSPPEDYLPYSYLEKMMTRTFEEEKLEVANKVKDSNKAWIDPEQVPKRPRRIKVHGIEHWRRAMDHTMRLEEWELSLRKKNTKEEHIPKIVVPVKVDKQRRRPKFMAKVSRHPKLSLSIPYGLKEPPLLPRQRQRHTSQVRLPEQRKERQGSLLRVLSEKEKVMLGVSRSSDNISTSLSGEDALTLTEQKSAEFLSLEDVTRGSSSSCVEEEREIKESKRLSEAAVKLDDIMRSGKIALAKEDLARREASPDAIKIDVRKVATPRKSRPNVEETLPKSPQRGPTVKEDEEAKKLSKYEILRMTTATAARLGSSSSHEEEDEQGMAVERCVSLLDRRKRTPNAECYQSLTFPAKSRSSPAFLRPIAYSATLSQHKRVMDKAFIAYCKQLGCGPVGPLMKKPLLPSPCPSFISSYADSEELHWYRVCMSMPQIPNSVLTRPRRRRPPGPLSFEELLFNQARWILDSLKADRPAIFYKELVPWPRPELVQVTLPQKVTVKGTQTGQQKGTQKSKREGRKKRKHKKKRKKWETLDEFAEIRNSLLPVFSTRLFPPYGSNLAAPDDGRPSQVTETSSQMVTLKHEHTDSRPSRTLSEPRRRDRHELAESYSDSGIIMHICMVHCFSEKWFPQDVPHRPKAVYRALLNLLHPMTQVDVLLEICRKIGILCVEANIPEDLKVHTAKLVVSLCSTHHNPRVRAGCLRILDKISPINRAILQVIIESLRSENGELKMEALRLLGRYGIRTPDQLRELTGRYSLLHESDPIYEQMTLEIVEKKMLERTQEGKGKTEKEQVLKHYRKLFAITNQFGMGYYKRKSLYRRADSDEQEHLSPLATMKSARPEIRMPQYVSDPRATEQPPKPFCGVPVIRKAVSVEPLKGSETPTPQSSRWDTPSEQPGSPGVAGEVDVEGGLRAPPTSPLSTASDVSMTAVGRHPTSGVVEQEAGECAGPEEKFWSRPSSAEEGQGGGRGGMSGKRRGRLEKSKGAGRKSMHPWQVRLSRTVDELLAPAPSSGHAARRSDSRSSLHFISTDESDDGELSESSFVLHKPVTSAKAKSPPPEPRKKPEPSKSPHKDLTTTITEPDKIPTKAKPRKSSRLKRVARPPAYGCYWAPGEPGIRVHHRTVPRASTPQGPPPSPLGYVSALDARLGVAPISPRQEWGRSHYGALCLEWTTRVPTLPVTGIVGKLRQIKKRGVLGRTRSLQHQKRVESPDSKRRTEGGRPQETLPFPTSVLIACLPEVTRTSKAMKVNAVTRQTTDRGVPTLSSK